MSHEFHGAVEARLRLVSNFLGCSRVKLKTFLIWISVVAS